MFRFPRSFTRLFVLSLSLSRFFFTQFAHFILVRSRIVCRPQLIIFAHDLRQTISRDNRWTQFPPSRTKMNACACANTIIPHSFCYLTQCVNVWRCKLVMIAEERCQLAKIRRNAHSFTTHACMIPWKTHVYCVETMGKPTHFFGVLSWVVVKIHTDSETNSKWNCRYMRALTFNTSNQV